MVGPWNHGGWRAGPGDKLGPIPFDAATGKYFRDDVEARFFAHYLKGEGALTLPEALTFEAGSNTWRRWEKWPPGDRTEVRRLHFGPDRTLSPGAPPTGGDDAFDSYVSDPAHPVPYRRRPIQPTYFPGGSQWRTWLVEDLPLGALPVARLVAGADRLPLSRACEPRPGVGSAGRRMAPPHRRHRLGA